jgi:methylenetetrahydrofolate--tRNA-(uracil-5-)-methyltransferase
MTQKILHIIGAGLAGSEAAWQAAQMGVKVVLHEMRPKKMTQAHQTGGFAELVCSNSFRSDDSDLNAVGLIHYEMRKLNSLIMMTGDKHQVPAGSALAVDRHGFSDEITAVLKAHPNIEIVYDEITTLPDTPCIIATGPLTSDALAAQIRAAAGVESLAFFDAIAPIVHKDSINMDIAWFQSRYDKVGPNGTEADYINCPMNKEQYLAFVEALLSGDKTEFKEWEGTPYFDGCLPIEIMAERGVETLRHGPMKARGLTNSHNPTVKAYAVVQLRQDNKLGTLYNMVGFQTKLKYGAQGDILRMIPGLEAAEFARMGGIHRNSYLNSPQLLDQQLRLKAKPNLRFAGQITGCEGYIESASVGLLAGRMAATEILGVEFKLPPPTTAFGALLGHITGGHIEALDEKKRSYQPMNINFGLFPPPQDVTKNDENGKRLKGTDKSHARKLAITQQAKQDLEAWMKNI